MEQSSLQADPIQVSVVAAGTFAGQRKTRSNLAALQVKYIKGLAILPPITEVTNDRLRNDVNEFTKETSELKDHLRTTGSLWKEELMKL